MNAGGCKVEIRAGFHGHSCKKEPFYILHPRGPQHLDASYLDDSIYYSFARRRGSGFSYPCHPALARDEGGLQARLHSSPLRAETIPLRNRVEKIKHV
jgi:hypothetical protein